VQTPNGGGKRFYDHSILSNLLEKINRTKPSNKHFIVGCTVMPEYIETIGNVILSDAVSCTLSYNPEFVAQGDIVHGFENPDIILLGTHSETLPDKIREIYDSMTKTTPKYCIMTPTEAEIVKISLNGFITTKISFANMVSDLCDTLSVSRDRVLDAIGSDSRIGTKYFRPGYSFGGPCFPRDTRALKQLMDQHGVLSSLLAATTDYNEEHIQFQTRQILEEHQKKREYYHIIEDVCYKENSKIPIIEESAKLKIAELLVKKYNQEVIIRDVEPIIHEVKKEYGNLFLYNIKL
jgi:nucleotide sugar dehydrogenase